MKEPGRARFLNKSITEDNDRHTRACPREASRLVSGS
jgi:hypothetical protein